MSSKAEMDMIPVSFAEAPASLGGLPPSGVDLIASRSSFYSSIERMKSLPPLQVPNRVYADDAIHQMYQRLSRGDFLANFGQRFGNTAVLVSFDAETKNECFAIVLLEHGDNIALTVVVTDFHSSSSVLKKTFAALSSSEQQRLAVRILHHYVRSSGFRLSWSVLQQVRIISKSILHRENGLNGSETLDIAMSLADIGINHGADHQFTLRSFRNVCLALHELGRYTDAALVYEETAEDYCEFEVLENDGGKFDLFAFAGDEWSNGAVFDKTEDAYIKALNISSRNNVDSSDKRIQQIIHNLLANYSKWQEREEMEQQPSAEITAVKHILATLVAMAGFPLKSAHITFIKPAMIQDNLKEEKNAQLALDRARKSSTPHYFREAILSCASNPKESHSQGKERVIKTNMKDNRVETTSQTKETGAEPVKCCNPACGAIDGETGVELMQCLCRGANYCDRRCQKAHWQEHKRICTYFLEHKGSKK